MATVMFWDERKRKSSRLMAKGETLMLGSRKVPSIKEIISAKP